VDGDNVATFQTYNADGWLASEKEVNLTTGCVLSQVSDTYDRSGNLLTSLDADGNLTRNTYDDGRLTGTTVWDAANHEISSTTSTYDEEGDPLTTTDGDGNTTTDTYMSRTKF